jgi:hypothetical protein
MMFGLRSSPLAIGSVSNKTPANKTSTGVFNRSFIDDRPVFRAINASNPHSQFLHQHYLVNELIESEIESSIA